MLNPNEYTVGWICAVMTEYVAAQSVLDEEHEGPENVAPNDNNTYTLGKMGKHNIAIAALPDGEYGTDTASAVARDMLHSFPNVRVGLMVGIGGGAPSPRHDIRLGDIVVSAPGRDHGGVFQYDFGKTIQTQSFQQGRFLNQPPMVLRTAVTGIKSEYERKGNQLEMKINVRLAQNPVMREKYARPDPKTDRLYHSHILHVVSDRDYCMHSCSDTPESLVSRIARTTEQGPMVHYGLIASANQLMKDACVRDKLSAEKDALCFEMEAAGLMNHFPCLVIRGICDYSDTHKNKIWQGYAAMGAAVYASDLLKKIPPARLEHERRLADIVVSVQKDVQENNLATQSILSIQQQDQIKRWLAPPDPSLNYHKALAQRHKGTGLWFLQSTEFTHWKAQHHSLLWLQGIPGCGKTVLSATMVEHLTDTLHLQPVLYFYFDFNDTRKQAFDNMLRSLIIQLFCMREASQKYLKTTFASCNEGLQQPSNGLLQKTFLSMIDHIEDVWIILDAVDECCTRSASAEDGLLGWIGDIHRTQKNIHLLFTGRANQDIVCEVQELEGSINIVELQSSFICADIREYVHARIRLSKGFKRWRSKPHVQDEIERGLMERVNGMFRWAACQLDSLQKHLDVRSLRAALECLPEGLEETYSQIIQSIPERYKARATLILQLLAFSERPLRLSEAVDAIEVDPESEPYFDPEYRMPDPNEVSQYCSSLVIVVSVSEKDIVKADDKELHLAHYSVKEYLVSGRVGVQFDKHFQQTEGRAAIAEICLAYLLQLREDLTRREIIERFPFAVYAAQYWIGHAKSRKKEQNSLGQLIMDLLKSHRQAYTNFLRLYNPDRLVDEWGPDIYNGEIKAAAGLYYASLGGLETEVKAILELGCDPNAQGGVYNNALQVASLAGHDAVVQMLLDWEVDVNAQGGLYGTALQAACSRGNNSIVQNLIAYGADRNIHGGRYGSAVQAAAQGGHARTILILLNHGADVNAQGGKYGSALQAAAHGGHEITVRALLDRGASINARGGVYGTALQAACQAGHERVVRLLLARGADAHATGGLYKSALHAACQQSCECVVIALINHGVDVNSGNGTNGDALQSASRAGQDSVVDLLLRRGSNVNAQGGRYGNALQAACAGMHEHIVQRLLKKGALVNAKGGKYGTALQVASRTGDIDIVQMLLDNRAEVNTECGQYGNPLQAACRGGHMSIVKMLLVCGANVNAQGGSYANALRAASSGGYSDIVQMLLHSGAVEDVPNGSI